MLQKRNEEISVSQALELIDQFQTVFDIVRFVDPAEREVLLLKKNGTIGREPYYCYKVWNKAYRCENCISVKTQCTGCRNSKYEFVNDDVFQVVANPYVICSADGRKINAVLELVNNATDEIVIEAFGKTELIEKINLTNKKIYQDSLTHVYNRRYFDERIFCFAGESNLKGNVAFVMVDLKKFKSINDTYGHDKGDYVLSSVGTALKECVRATDAVIRMGGDEFLIVLKNCPKAVIASIVEKMSAAVNMIIYDQNQELHAIANFGWAYTDDFTPSDGCIGQLMTNADERMYANKNA